MNDDPYILKNGTLKNKLNIKDPIKLDKAEVALTADRLVEIEKNGPKGAFNFAQNCSLHSQVYWSFI